MKNHNTKQMIKSSLAGSAIKKVIPNAFKNIRQIRKRAEVS